MNVAIRSSAICFRDRQPCKACLGTGLISADWEPPDDDELLSADEMADLLGVPPPLPPTVRHSERMSPATRLALRLFPDLEACE